MPSNHLILCHPLLLLPSIFPSIRVLSIELAHIRWPECWSFSICPSNEYSGLISFKIDWFDILAVQRTLKSLLQYHSSKASSSALSLLYGTPLIYCLKNSSCSRTEPGSTCWQTVKPIHCHQVVVE